MPYTKLCLFLQGHCMYLFRFLSPWISVYFHSEMILVQDTAGHAFPKWVERLKTKKDFDHTIYGISAPECKWNSISNLKNELKQGVLGDMESE